MLYLDCLLCRGEACQVCDVELDIEAVSGQTVDPAMVDGDLLDGTVTFPTWNAVTVRVIRRARLYNGLHEERSAWVNYL